MLVSGVGVVVYATNTNVSHLHITCQLLTWLVALLPCRFVVVLLCVLALLGCCVAVECFHSRLHGKATVMV